MALLFVVPCLPIGAFAENNPIEIDSIAGLKTIDANPSGNYTYDWFGFIRRRLDANLHLAI